MSDIDASFDAFLAASRSAGHGRTRGPSPSIDFEPFGEERVAPAPVPAVRREVDDVEMQRRRFVGEVDEVARPRVEARVAVEQVDERDRGDDPRAALPARRDRRLPRATRSAANSASASPASSRPGARPRP